MPANRSAPRQPGTHPQLDRLPEARQIDAGVLATILDLNLDGLVTLDRDDRVCHVSAAFASMTGLNQQRLLGLHEDQFWQLLSTLGHPPHAPNSVPQIRQHLSEPESQRRNVLELLHPEHRLLRVFQQRHEADDLRVLCFRDATRELDIDRRKSEFLSTAAHELRAPLACIYGFSENLMHQNCDAAMQREFIDIIHQQAHAMADLLDEMLDLARIESRRQDDLAFEHISARQLVQDVLRAYQPMPSRDAPVLLACDPDIKVRVDTSKAHQVLLNVLSNAYKYSPGGGAVKITIEPRAAGFGDDSAVQIDIHDQGIGMSASQLARVFERFYRANSVPEVRGAGLGLNIAQEIMRLMGGSIDIDSTVGVGTRVSLRFPRA